jgi:F-type H+-transporting ATPase subunit b
VFILNTNQAFGAKGGMPQLNTEFWASQIFWLILIFSILYIIIWKIFLPKITDIIENRKSRIIGDLNETQKLKENAEKKLSEYNKIIEDTKKEAKKIIEDNKKNWKMILKAKNKNLMKKLKKN